MAEIKKLLVANRGEIAIRIFRACEELGIASVAVYSEIDRDALHTSFADESYLLGDTAPSESYLNTDRIIEVALRAEADSIHPGYGFLAENAGFARAVQEAGLTWVGPPAEAIDLMGDKTAARRAAREAGVKSVPGTPSAAKGPDEIEAFAKEYGWPVALKAAHGGGGRGFRVVEEPAGAAEAFEGAAREAQMSFGNPEIYLERYLSTPRHVEVQVLGDSRGNLIHLGERDCSLQRRHQKLIEESPSTAVDKQTRDAICQAALDVAGAAGYQSAGTVEFLLENTPDGPRFWFLEMNTRLQVEHPVTELVAGVDLAKEMIRVAAGEELSLSQSDIRFNGHAIECRINAEDPAKNFMPSPGTIDAYSEPSGPGVRVDSGVVAGSQIPQAYDSLIAKLICWGRDRDDAIAKTTRALKEFSIAGLRTTVPFHQRVMESDWFRSGEFHTNTVERDLDLSDLIVGAKAQSGSKSRAERLVVELDGKRFEATIITNIGNKRRPQAPAVSSRKAHAGVGETITAPMQGTIVKSLVAQGQEVKAGDSICVLEAMKMENLIVCHRDGRVARLEVGPGKAVSSGDVLAVIEAV